MILEHAVRSADVTGLRKLLKQTSHAVFEERDKNERTALILACINGNLEILNILLERGARTSCRDKWGKTALMYAVQRGNPEVIRLVLKFGADTTDYDNAGKTVEEHIASTCRSKEEIAELLRESRDRHLRRINSLPEEGEAVEGAKGEGIESSPSSPKKKKGSPSKLKTAVKEAPPDFTYYKDILDFARRGDNEGMRQLLPQAGGVTVDGLNSRDQMGRTPLMVALLNGKTETMRMLLDAGAETRCFDNAGKCILFYAIAKRNMEAVEMLLAANASIAVTDSNGRTPLMEACMDANIPAVRALLEAGASTRPKDDRGRTALMYAVAKGNLDLIRVLLDAGANASERDTKGKTVEDYGVSTLSFNVVSKMLKNAISVQKAKASMKKQNSMPSGPESEADLNALDSPNRTLSRSKSQQQVLSPWNPLANKSALEMVRTGDKRGLLILLGGGLSEVGVNERDSKGRTALMVACIYDKEDILDILLENGGDLGAKDNQGKTVLFHAVSTGNVACMQRLMKAGATANTTDSFGRTPLIQACIFGNVRAMEEFISSGGVNVDATDMWGKSALMYATSKGDLEAMRILMDAGASVDAVDIGGKSVEEYGLSVKNFEAVRRAIHEEREKRERQQSRPSPGLKRASSMPVERSMAPVGILDLARKGDRESIKVALGKDASSVVVNDRDKNNRTPLILACLHSKREIMDELLRVGAYVNQKDRWGKSALMYAVSKGDAEATSMLLEHRADPLDVDYENRTVEEQALAGGRNCDEVLQLLSRAREKAETAQRHAHSTEATDQSNGVEGWMEEGGENSPVRAAPAYSMTAPGILDLARKGDGHSMRVALQRDCSSVVINEQDKNGRTPMMLAALYAKRESLQELVRVGADIHMKDKWGKTALMYATSKGDLIAIQILLDAGANPHDTDWDLKAVDEQAIASCRSYDATLEILQEAKKERSPMKKQSSFRKQISFSESSSSPSGSPAPGKKKRTLKKLQSAPPSLATLDLLDKQEAAVKETDKSTPVCGGSEDGTSTKNSEGVI